MATTLFNNLITFSRGTNATLVGADGLVQYAPNNLLTYSEQFDNAAWTKTRSSITANATAAPDGTLTADKLVEDTTATNSHLIYNTSAVTVTNATSYTVSYYAKYAGRQWIYVAPSFSTGTAYFDVQNGALGTVANGTATITSVGNGWYRCAFTVTSNATTGFVFTQLAPANGTVNYTGDGTSGIYIWGAQLELGTTATTYNSTTVKNLLGYSEAFDNAAWTKTNSSIVTGAAANPLNGLFTAQKLMENTASGGHTVDATATVVSGVVYTTSIYAKAGERTSFSFRANNDNSVATFNLSNGTVGTPTNATASIQSAGAGWYRCSLTWTATSSASVVASRVRMLDGSGNSTYTGDGNSGVYIYGAQLSDSGSLDPYVPTPGAAPTSAAYYGPRFDYDPVTLQPKGLLIEEARTNLLTYSEQFDNAAWIKSSSTVTANATTAPDGTATAERLIPAAASIDGRASQSFTGSAGATYTLTVYGKADAFSNIRLYSDDGATNLASVSYNLATGVVSTAANVGGTWASVSTTSAAVGNGWYRLSLTWTATGAAPTRVAIWCRDTGNGTSGIYIWGAQLEAGAFATSYIPTVASTVTRSADVATITGSLFSGWYNGAQGTFVVGASTFSSAALSRTVASLGGPVNTFAAYVHSGASGAMYDGTNLVLTANQITTNTAFELSTAYSSSGIAACLNNGAVATNATYSGAFGNSSSLGIGNFVAGGLLNGHIRSITYLPVRNADYQIQGFTA